MPFKEQETGLLFEKKSSDVRRNRNNRFLKHTQLRGEGGDVQIHPEYLYETFVFIFQRSVYKSLFFGVRFVTSHAVYTCILKKPKQNWGVFFFLR